MVLNVKKGNAATFVFVLAALILVYVVLVPQESLEGIVDLDTQSSQENILDDNDYNSGERVSSSKRLLISDVPGFITDDGRLEFDYNIPSVTIFRTTESGLIQEENPFFIKNGWFTKKEKDLSFEIENLELVDNFLVSFNAPVHEGSLFVKLNGNIVYEKKLDAESPEPIKLPKRLLKQGANNLTLSASSVGLAFWRANDVSFENFKIFADVTDDSRDQTQSTFNIPTERMNIKRSDLKFIPECDVSTAGLLKVRLNGEVLSYNVPDCGSVNEISLDPALLISGTNTVEFETSAGSYLVDLIKVKTYLRKSQSPTYYFDIDSDLWEDIEETKDIAHLSFEFLLPSDHHIEMKVNVNGRNFGIREFGDSYSTGVITDDEYNYSTVGYSEGKYYKVIDNYLKKGDNYIRLEPLDDVDIVDVRLEIEKLKKVRSSRSGSTSR
ncbi:hypothetical protein KY321_02775 [Candidatus Woesearchaeota archaeon]|nr:hypothetical protein [Candidatus Woesearchaeota archaeon]